MAKQEPIVIELEEQKVIKLKEPKVVTLTGTIVAMNEKPEGGKFKHDTVIVTVEDLESGNLADVFITQRQFKEYGCKKSVYMGNVVTFSLEECIEGVTGYKEFADSVELKPHDGTYKAFARAIETSTMSVRKELSKSGVDNESIRDIIQELNNVRKFNNM